MQFKTRVIYSALFSGAALVASFIIPIIPCRIAPSIPSAAGRWTMCSLNPDSVGSLNSIKEYFGYTQGLTNAYFVTLILAFVVAMITLHFTRKKKK